MIHAEKIKQNESGVGFEKLHSHEVSSATCLGDYTVTASFDRENCHFNIVLEHPDSDTPHTITHTIDGGNPKVEIRDTSLCVLSNNHELVAQYNLNDLDKLQNGTQAMNLRVPLAKAWEWITTKGTLTGKTELRDGRKIATRTVPDKSVAGSYKESWIYGLGKEGTKQGIPMVAPRHHVVRSFVNSDGDEWVLCKKGGDGFVIYETEVEVNNERRSDRQTFSGNRQICQEAGVFAGGQQHTLVGNWLATYDYILGAVTTRKIEKNLTGSTGFQNRLFDTSELNINHKTIFTENEHLMIFDDIERSLTAYSIEENGSLNQVATHSFKKPEGQNSHTEKITSVGHGSGKIILGYDSGYREVLNIGEAS